METLLYWLYACGIFLIFFIPGFAIAQCIKNLNGGEKLSVSFGISFLFLLVLLPFFAFKLALFGRIFFICIFGISLWFLFKKRKEIYFDSDARYILFVLIAGIAMKLFLQIFWEYPVIGGDWFSHTFLLPHALNSGNWTSPQDRTALFSILIFSLHSVLNTSLYQFWISQIASIVMNSIFIIPAYFIAKKVFSNTVAKTSILFLLVTPFLNFQTLYTWPKNAAMYGILMMIYFLFFSDQNVKFRYIFAGFFAGFAFWFHNYSLIYIGVAVLILAYCAIRSRVKNILFFVVPLFLILIPYCVWIYISYGTFSSSRFFYYPIAVRGYDSAFTETPRELWKIFRETPLREIFLTRIENAVITFTPATLPIDPIATSFPHYNPIYYYSHDLPGALSTLMYIAVLCWFFAYIFRKRKTSAILVSFIFLPTFIFLLIWGWRDWGLLTAGFNPTIPLLVMLGMNELYSWNTRYMRLIIYILFISAIIENDIFAFLIGKFYLIEGGIQALAKTGRQYIPDFQISQFISAHFLMEGSVSVLYNFLILVGILIGAYFFYKKSVSKEESL